LFPLTLVVAVVGRDEKGDERQCFGEKGKSMETIGNPMMSDFGQAWLGDAPTLGPQNAGESAMPVLGGDRLGMRRISPTLDQGVGMGNASPGGIFAGFLGVMQGIFNQIASLMQRLMGQPSSAGAQQYFQNASLSSTGDPHEALNATTGTGQNLNAKWDNMCSHDHLITSDAVAGGFNVATRATAPGAGGVTYNDRVRISTNGGNTLVTMGKDGAYSVIDDGRTVHLSSGVASQLGNGEAVTLNANGSLSVDVTNAQGGNIETTLQANGLGVDVNAAASNIDLGGYLVSRER
jgi:hypothetical protein